MDITQAIQAIHIGIAGVSFQANSHAALKSEADFNIPLAEGKYWYTAGVTSCLQQTLKLESNGTYKTGVNTGCPVQWTNGVMVRKPKPKPVKKTVIPQKGSKTTKKS